MSPDVAAQAFEPFFTTKPEGLGSGLGLSMVYGFVLQSGGHVRLLTEAGSGTAVQIYLQHTSERIPEASVATPSHEVERGHEEMILVVEDNEMVRSLTVELLEHLGYRAIAADGADAALAHLSSDADINLHAHRPGAARADRRIRPGAAGAGCDPGCECCSCPDTRRTCWRVAGRTTSPRPVDEAVHHPAVGRRGQPADVASHRRDALSPVRPDASAPGRSGPVRRAAYAGPFRARVPPSPRRRRGPRPGDRSEGRRRGGGAHALRALRRVGVHDRLPRVGRSPARRGGHAAHLPPGVAERRLVRARSGLRAVAGDDRPAGGDRRAAEGAAPSRRLARGRRPERLRAGLPAPERREIETVWSVRSAIESLEPDDREIVKLQHLDGWSHTQIAERLGCRSAP